MQNKSLQEGLLQGKPLAIARAITAVENETPAAKDIIRFIQSHLGNAQTIGVTGPPGAGKSTLISAIISELVNRGKKIAVVAVDPTSSISGGALLGDRVRMAAHSRNANVFIRSLATKGHLGGLTRMTSTVVDVLDAAGMDVVIIETVGTGQSEIEIADLAHIKLVICPPGLGDEMQAIKAGILEVADILVVNKADLPGAEETAQHLNNMLHCAGDRRQRTVMKTSSTIGSGVQELVTAIEVRIESLKVSSGSETLGPTWRTKRMLAVFASNLIGKYIRELEGSRVDMIYDGMQSGQMSPDLAFREILKIFLGHEPHWPSAESSKGRPQNGA